MFFFLCSSSFRITPKLLEIIFHLVTKGKGPVTTVSGLLCFWVSLLIKVVNFSRPWYVLLSSIAILFFEKKFLQIRKSRGLDPSSRQVTSELDGPEYLPFMTKIRASTRGLLRFPPTLKYDFTSYLNFYLFSTFLFISITTLCSFLPYSVAHHKPQR